MTEHHIIVESREEYVTRNRKAILYFFRYFVPIMMMIIGYSNYNEPAFDEPFFKYVAWIGTGWLILSFTPQILRLIKKFDKG